MKKEIRNVLGPKIRCFRKKAGISQEFLCARMVVQGIRMDRTIISQIENQRREIYDFEIIAIAKALRIDFNEFFKDISI